MSLCEPLVLKWSSELSWRSSWKIASDTDATFDEYDSDIEDERGSMERAVISWCKEANYRQTLIKLKAVDKDQMTGSEANYVVIICAEFFAYHITRARDKLILMPKINPNFRSVNQRTMIKRLIAAKDAKLVVEKTVF